MQLQTNAEIKIVEKNTFPDEAGNTIGYFTAYLKNDEGEVLKINSKKDLSPFEGQNGVVTVWLRDQGGKTQLLLELPPKQ